VVDKKSGEVISALQQAKPQLPPEAIEKVTEVQSVAADTSVKAIAVLAEKHEQDNEVVPASDVTNALESHAKIVSEVTSAQPLTVSLIVGTASSTDVSTSTTITTSSSVMLLATTPVDGSTTTTSSTLPNQVITLPDALSQLKTATTQAFDLQKTKDKQDTAAANASSSTMGAENTGTTSSTPQAATSTSGTVKPESSSSTETQAPPKT
jgi:hypothetical protein